MPFTFIFNRQLCHVGRPLLLLVAFFWQASPPSIHLLWRKQISKLFPKGLSSLIVYQAYEHKFNDIIPLFCFAVMKCSTIPVHTNTGEQDDQKSKSTDADVSERDEKIFCKGTSVMVKQKGADQTMKMVDTPRALRRQNALLEKIKEIKVIEGLLLV